MDFFGDQERARRRSRWLLLWCLLAIAVIVGVLYLAVSLIAFRALRWDLATFAATALIAGGAMLIASFLKMGQLSRRGGSGLATDLGGRPVLRSTQSPEEKRLLNVIDEMALAAGIPAPRAFVLERENRLNAFAAGFRVGDSVIAVTGGLLAALDRDALQGVIAHEISHIVNGDARLNLRLIGMLHGILFLAVMGLELMTAPLRVLSGGENEEGFRQPRRFEKRLSREVPADLLAPGLILMLIAFFMGALLLLLGSLGVLFSTLIKAGVSRQREFLADAAAVQYTRNPEALIDALRTIADGGSQVDHAKAEEASHIFFAASGDLLERLFSTHPPIEARIARILELPEPEDAPIAAPASHEEEGMAIVTFLHAGPVTATSAVSAPRQTNAARPVVEPPSRPASLPPSLARARAFLARLPASLSIALAQGDSAALVVYALLIGADQDVRKRQLNIIARQHGAAAIPLIGMHLRWLAAQGPEVRLPLLDLALPALAELPPTVARALRSTVVHLVRADGHLSLWEFACMRILQRTLTAGRDHVSPSYRAERLGTHIALLLAMLARVDGGDGAACHDAFQRGIAIALPNATAQTAPAVPTAQAMTLKSLAQALDELAAALPLIRKRLLSACVAVVQQDGKISVAEAELLRAIAQSLDCPGDALPAASPLVPAPTVAQMPRPEASPRPATHPV